MLVVGWTHDDLSPTIQLDLIWQVSQIFIFANFLPGHAFNLAHLTPKKRQNAGKKKPKCSAAKRRIPNDQSSSKSEIRKAKTLRQRFVIRISFVIRLPRRSQTKAGHSSFPHP